jgi:hydrophobic/amphiphilic exporter-1 (mainly G- bacteria), HAE1 family
MFLSDISIKRPIMMTMFLLVFVLFGGIAYFSLDLNLMPDIEVPYVTVQTVYPGAGPKELESEVTKKIEDAVSTISQIKSLVSYSLEGVSILQIEFELDKDVDIANQETKDKVDAILNDLPDDAETPIIQKFEIGADPVVDLVLTGNMSPVELYELADKRLKDRFSQINGVASVDIVGGQQREIKIELDNRIVYQNSISLLQLSQIIAAENVDIPGGNFKRASQEYSARLKGKYSSLEALRNLEITTPSGKKILGKIANVSDSGEEVRIRSTFFQNLSKSKENNVVILSVIKAKDGNTVELAEQVQNILPELKNELPDGVELEVVTDKSIFIKASVEDTLTNIGMGVILTALVLLFFLHDLRSTIIAALSMPFSIISTFMLLDFSGYSLNVMTLMGLSTSVGILVANSIVVLENIFRHKEMGNGKKEAAGKGTSEVVIAVIASAMTNIVVFLPLANMSSLIGSVFKEFALTVTYATVFSIIVSFTLTPMLASIILPEHDTKKHIIGEWLEKLFNSWERAYQNILGVIVKNRLSSGVTVIAAVVMFFASLFIAGQLSFEFMPLMDEGLIAVEVELPQGYNLEQTAELLEETEKRIVGYDEVKNTLTQIGKINDLNQGTNLALIKVQLIDAENRDISTTEMVTKFIRNLSDIPNAMFRVAVTNSGAGGDMVPVELYLQGIDLEKLENYKTELEAKFKTIEGLTNLNTSSRAGKPEITLQPDRIKLANAGLTAYDLAMTLRAGMEGLITTKFSDGGEEYDIRISLNDESVDSPEKIANMTVISRNGKYTMNQLAEIDFTEGYSRILHRDKAKTIQFTANIAEGYALGDIVNEVEKRIDKMEFESGYSISWAGTAEMMNEVIFDMGFAFILAIILTYMLLAAILESFTQPLLILATIPMALIGVFLALYVFGISISVFAMLAIVMLIGIVVNNAILLLDYTNVLVRKGKSVKDALVEACPTKLKPVIMSTIAIMLGMLPMALGIGSAGKEYRQPIGVVSIGGLLISGVITLFVIPALYELTHRSKKAAEGDKDE